MSIAVMDAVWRAFEGSQGELLLALVLADHAGDDGTKIFPSVASMAAKTRQSERTVQYQLRRMEASGWLVKVAKATGGRRRGNFKHDGFAGYATEYRISPEWIAEHVPAKRESKMFHAKGAKSAPLSGATAPVDNLECEPVKGAESAPFDETKGATDDRIGCNPRQDRVQQLLHPNHQEPSLTVTSVVVDNARASNADTGCAQFPMYHGWAPGDGFAHSLHARNVSRSTLSPARLIEFVSYWLGRPDTLLTQAGWEHKLAQRLQMIQMRLDVSFGGESLPGDVPAPVLAAAGLAVGGGHGSAV